MILNVIWFLLVGVLIIGYAVLDGFDLGIGSLYYQLARTEQEKLLLAKSIGPVWDGNEVWLLTGGGALFAAFPIVYSTVFSGFYLAMLLVLYGLILRAVSIEYLPKADTAGMKSVLNKMFFIGSLLPALLFGVAMGDIVKGLALNQSQYYAGTFWNLLNPYALLFGVLGLFAFMLHGANYALIKTEGSIFERAQKLAPKLWLIFVVLYIIATVYSIFAAPHLFKNYENNIVLYTIPVLTWVFIFMIPIAQKRKNYLAALLASGASIAGMILILAAGLFPNIVPATDPSLSLNIYNAASSNLTLKTMLIIAGVGVPIVIIYTAYVYTVFKGKVKADSESY